MYNRLSDMIKYINHKIKNIQNKEQMSSALYSVGPIIQYTSWGICSFNDFLLECGVESGGEWERVGVSTYPYFMVCTVYSVQYT